MISVSEMRKIEKKAEEIGITQEIMMENAGANAAKIVNDKIGLKGKRVLVFCGIGNNGGDGLVFARHSLIYGAKVYIYFVKSPDNGSELLKRNYEILKKLMLNGKPIKIYIEKLPKENEKFDVLVDAIFGIGLKNVIRNEFKEAIEKFNQMKGFKISIDCPSGIDCDTGEVMGIAAKPNLTITFYDIKKGLNEKNSGEIIIADIGIPKVK
ncbi:MAG: NAD(P)H-hydrate epimerase [Candidatus Aenigmatarchaeota archaeon]